jgi:hypothetical protein
VPWVRGLPGRTRQKPCDQHLEHFPEGVGEVESQRRDVATAARLWAEAERLTGVTLAIRVG